MEHSALGSSRKQDDGDQFNLREWAHKAKISREKTNSRRYSASYIRSFREDFRSNVNISSTASSPGYTLKEEIDPSTYSFTTALKALQAKTLYSWEYMSPDGLALNSKWNEAEKYICNPLSGEVPLECLSSRSLNERSFRKVNSRITVSGPLIYPSHIQTKLPAKPCLLPTHEEKKEVSIETKSNVAANYISSSSPSPAPTPSIEESSIKQCEEADSSPSIKESSTIDDACHSPITTPKLQCDDEEKVEEGKETGGGQKGTKRKEEGLRKKAKQFCSSYRKSGCFLWRSLWMRTTNTEKHKSRNNNIFVCHINGCYKE